MTVSSYLLVGVRLSDVFRVEEKTVEMIVYDPLTGLPYNKKSIEEKYYLFDKEIQKLIEKFPHYWKYSSESVEKLLEGLEIYFDGQSEELLNYNNYIVGKEIAKCGNLDSKGDIKKVELQLLLLKLGEVQEIFNKLECKKKVDLFLLGYSSS